MNNKSLTKRVVIKSRFSTRKKMKGKVIPEKGKSNCKIPTVGMSLASSSPSRVGEVADVDENQSRVGLETKNRRLMLFSVPQETGL